MFSAYLLPSSRHTLPAFLLHAPTDPTHVRGAPYPPRVTQAVEDCELFTLQRIKFREMLALSVSASLVQRVAWMQATPELVRDGHGEGELWVWEDFSLGVGPVGLKRMLQSINTFFRKARARATLLLVKERLYRCRRRTVLRVQQSVE